MLGDAMNLLQPAVQPADPAPPRSSERIDTEALLLFSTDPDAPPPDVRPCDTPNASDALQDLTADKIYRLFGNRRFRNFETFGATSKDSKYDKGGEPVTSLGEFANLRKSKRGKVLPPLHTISTKSTST